MSPESKSADLITPNSVERGVAFWDVSLSATRTLAVWENQLEIYYGDRSAAGSAVGSAGTLMMPEAGEAAGQRYYIHMINDGSDTAGTVVVHFPDDPWIICRADTTEIPAVPERAAAWGDAGQDLTAVDDYLVLSSNGRVWFVEFNRTT